MVAQHAHPVIAHFALPGADTPEPDTPQPDTPQPDTSGAEWHGDVPAARSFGVDVRAAGATRQLEAPEPIDLRPQLTLRQRLQRAITVPAIAAAVVFVAIVCFSIATVWLRPHDPAVLEPTTPTDATLDGFDIEQQPLGVGTDIGTNGAPLGGAASATTPTRVFVHVVGEVAKPGVYELAAGERVAAAIGAAGGATEHAVLASINLARVLNDGEQIVVPDAETAAAVLADAPAGGTSGANAASVGALVNLNTADSRALETLPRVGPALAQRILDWRDTHGGFSSVDQLLNVSGIGQKTFEQLSSLVTI